GESSLTGARARPRNVERSDRRDLALRDCLLLRGRPHGEKQAEAKQAEIEINLEVHDVLLFRLGSPRTEHPIVRKRHGSGRGRRDCDHFIWRTMMPEDAPSVNGQQSGLSTDNRNVPLVTTLEVSPFGSQGSVRVLVTVP